MGLRWRLARWIAGRPIEPGMDVPTYICMRQDGHLVQFAVGSIECKIDYDHDSKVFGDTTNAWVPPRRRGTFWGTF